MAQKTIIRSKLSPLHMGSGGRGKPKKVIDAGLLFEYVGIGWVRIRAATKDDKKKYPRVID